MLHDAPDSHCSELWVNVFCHGVYIKLRTKKKGVQYFAREIDRSRKQGSSDVIRRIVAAAASQESPR